MVQIFMDTIEKPEEELLGILLCVSPVLHGTPCHSILHKCTSIIVNILCWQFIYTVSEICSVDHYYYLTHAAVPEVYLAK